MVTGHKNGATQSASVYKFCRLHVPELVPFDAESLAQHAADERYRKPDDGARISFDPSDKRLATAVDRECAGNLQRLSGGDVGIHFGV